jgi:hypothetical protein
MRASTRTHELRASVPRNLIHMHDRLTRRRHSRTSRMAEEPYGEAKLISL